MRAMIGLFAMLASVSLATAQAAPATRPAVVLVLAFDPVMAGDVTNNVIGQGIQQSLLAELGRMRHLRGVLPASQPAEEGAMVTTATALAAGKAAGACYVVYGAYQISGQQIRLTGQVLDVDRAGVALGSMKATAGADNVFEAQDAIALQLRRLLPAPMMVATGIQPTTRPMTAEERWPWQTSTSGGWRSAGYWVDDRAARMDATLRRQAVWADRPFGWHGWGGYGWGCGYGYYGTNLGWGLW